MAIKLGFRSQMCDLHTKFEEYRTKSAVAIVHRSTPKQTDRQTDVNSNDFTSVPRHAFYWTHNNYTVMRTYFCMFIRPSRCFNVFVWTQRAALKSGKVERRRRIWDQAKYSANWLCCTTALVQRRSLVSACNSPTGTCLLLQFAVAEMSLHREFPWIPWVPFESHGKKYYSNFVGMGKSMAMAWWEWQGMTTLHFPNYHSEQANNFLYDFQLFSISKDFYLSWVTGYWFHDCLLYTSDAADE